MTDVTGLQQVGLDKHLSDESDDVKNTEIKQEIDENNDEVEDIRAQNYPERNSTSPSYAMDVSHPSHPSPELQAIGCTGCLAEPIFFCQK